MAEIFLMEDSAPLRRVLIEELRAAGHNVTALEDGIESGDNEFLASADLLLTDIDMPNVNGYEVVRKLKASLPNLPIIVMTGLAPKDVEAVECEKLLFKPVNSQTLLDEIDIHLKQKSNPVSA